jgi:ABC-type nitrate/sulfonate/bicarbonate transport system permease component
LQKYKKISIIARNNAFFYPAFFLRQAYFLPKHLHISIILRTFVPVPERTIEPIYSPFKTHSIMNKTWKTILQVISYVITLLLGGAAGNVMM